MFNITTQWYQKNDPLIKGCSYWFNFDLNRSYLEGRPHVQMFQAIDVAGSSKPARPPALQLPWLLAYKEELFRLVGWFLSVRVEERDAPKIFGELFYYLRCRNNDFGDDEFVMTEQISLLPLKEF